MAPSEDVFVGSIDQGTTSSRFLIFDRKGEPVADHQEVCHNLYILMTTSTWTPVRTLKLKLIPIWADFFCFWFL